MKYSDGKLTIDCADPALFKHLVNTALAFDSKKPKAASPPPKIGFYTVGTVLHEYVGLKRHLDCGGCVNVSGSTLVYKKAEDNCLYFWSDKWEKSTAQEIHELALPVVATEAPDGNYTLGTKLTAAQAERYVRLGGLVQTTPGLVISFFNHKFRYRLGQTIHYFRALSTTEKYTVIG